MSGSWVAKLGGQTRIRRSDIAATQHRLEFRDRGLLLVQQLLDLFEPVSRLSQGRRSISLGLSPRLIL